MALYVYNFINGEKKMITINEQEFYQFVEFVNANYGINLSEKKILIESRLQPVLAENDLKSFSEYYKYIINDKTGEVVSNLINKLTTNHTFFMREKEHFNYFRSTVLPYLTTKAENKDLRIWSAGCSSGEEPYTLAMIIDEYFGKQKMFWDTKILATDISGSVLDKAVEGIYPDENLKGISEAWKNEYFKQIGDGKYQINDRIRNEVIFRRFNLKNQEFPFSKKFHVIFCRNVLIYFDNRNKRELIERFYNFTENGGFLFIGHSESISSDGTKYKYIMPATYRKE